MGQHSGENQTAPLIAAGAQAGPSNAPGRNNNIPESSPEPELPLSFPPRLVSAPRSKWEIVILISRDGKAFEISKAAAQLSDCYGPIVAYMEDLYSSSDDTPIIEIPEHSVDSTMLELIATYINGRAANVDDEVALQDFHRQFLPAGETAKELLDKVVVASEIAKIPTLTQLVSEKIDQCADKLKGMRVSETSR